MNNKTHTYQVTVAWTGNKGAGTAGYKNYGRDYEIRAGDKPAIPGSSDPSFLGDPARWNPEDLLVASLSACHKLWYLHLCAVSGVTVVAYEDEAEGAMVEDKVRGGSFETVTLRPKVTITADSDPQKARALHQDAHEKCFIANSVNFAVGHEPEIRVET